MRAAGFVCVLLATLGVAHAGVNGALRAPSPAEAEEEAFQFRGLMPWHNFLSGPTAWDWPEWKQYLDRAADARFNMLMLHSYTGGSQRYNTYVDTLLTLQYRGLSPTQAECTSTYPARWGYTPMPVSDFMGGEAVARLYVNATTNDRFGSQCATADMTNGSPLGGQRECQQALLRKVMKYAGSRGIKTAMGFEFSVWPPEFNGVAEKEGMLSNPYQPNPFAAPAMEILRSTLNGIVSEYPDVEYLVLWQEENPLMFTGAGATPQLTGKFQDFYASSSGNFSSYLSDPALIYTGVWCMAHIMNAHSMIKNMPRRPTLVLGGWGGQEQLTPLLQGLHSGLPQDIIFSILNPDLGLTVQPAELAKIRADGRGVWVVPWLESDGNLWHPQPRVSLLHSHVSQARKDGLDGVVAIHWRTGADVSMNMDAFEAYTQSNQTTPDEVWFQHLVALYGPDAAADLIPMYQQAEASGALARESPDYFEYSTTFGRLDAAALKVVESIRSAAVSHAVKNPGGERTNALNRLARSMDFILNLDAAGRELEPVNALRTRALVEYPGGQLSALECRSTADGLEKGGKSVEEAVLAYADRTTTRGDLGVLSSINQKLVPFFRDLVAWHGAACPEYTKRFVR